MTGKGKRISMSSRPSWSSSKFQATQGYIGIRSQKKNNSDIVRNEKPAKDTKDFGAEKPFWNKITGVLRKLRTPEIGVMACLSPQNCRGRCRRIKSSRPSLDTY